MPFKDLLANDAFYLYVDDGSELAEVLIELGDVVELSGDLANLQLGVHVVIPLGKNALMLVVEVCPETRGKRSVYVCQGPCFQGKIVG